MGNLKTLFRSLLNVLLKLNILVSSKTVYILEVKVEFFHDTVHEKVAFLSVEGFVDESCRSFQ